MFYLAGVYHSGYYENYPAGNAINNTYDDAENAKKVSLPMLMLLEFFGENSS